MAIGFWKFVLATSLLIGLLRGGSNVFSHLVSALPVSVFVWGLYRVARLQPWWPFGEQGSDSASRIGALKEAILNRSALVQTRRTSVLGPSPKPSLSKKPIATEPEVFAALASPTSSIGTRTKTERSKTSRKKTLRSKRRPGVL
jgi:hypothetical protein